MLGQLTDQVLLFASNGWTAVHVVPLYIARPLELSEEDENEATQNDWLTQDRASRNTTPPGTGGAVVHETPL